MKWISKGRKKKYSIIRLIKSFGYAIRGIVDTYQTEQNMLIHTIISIIVILMSIYFKISKIEICIIVLTIALVVSLELVNTAIENVVDMSMPNIHPLAKIAKDTASGAVLVAALASIIIGLIIFLPKVLALL